MNHISYMGDATPLTRYKAFKCDDVDEVVSVVSDVFCPHSLDLKHHHRLPNFRMNHVKFGKSSSLNYLRYGEAVTVEPGEMAEVFNIQVQLSGKTETVCGNETNTTDSGSATVLSPGQYVKMGWDRDASMLIYSVRRTAVEHTLESLLGSHIFDPVTFTPAMNCKKNNGANIFRTLSFLKNELEVSEQLLNTPLAVDHFEQSLILSLLYGQTHNYTDALRRGLSTIAPVHVKRVERYIHEHATEKVTINDLTEVAGVSARALFAGFKSFRNTSPMKYLQQVRMDKVRKDLMEAVPSDTVTEIALNWGFSQLGRFSVDYKKRFGESPSETLQARLQSLQ